MSDRYAIVAIKGDVNDTLILELINSLAVIGVCLEYPGTSAVRVLDEIGEAHDFSRQDFLELLRERKLTFQWWWNTSEDTRCTIRCADGRTMMYFWRDGHSDRQERSLLSALREFYKTLASQGRAIGFAADRDGDTILYPWGDILTGKADIPGSYPDEIIVPRALADRIARRAPNDTKIVEEGDDVMFVAPYYVT